MSSKNASAANCGFVLHVSVLLVGGLYVLWISHLLEDTVFYFDPTTFHQQGVASLVVIFFATIVVYFVLNAFSVPRIDSNDTITDDFAHPCRPELVISQQYSKTLPSICDIDVAIINDMVWASRNAS
ncbi:hypothetical protein FisN_23Lh186 [Fistulifera solaris]|uniref:PIG-P domain-containing protein n=1 Tax=Fistulifera solaris TaxID=1519565 RepID=A0A1Z5K5I3_FISSO|nr:hypothetical protein FisN_23Lh186 [Fistulifera solaris]|eukprot:GAX21238.1 hypothetical protein FisN_23Lh186 [Fistulifera solaris]